MSNLTKKEKRFNGVLTSMKRALDSINVKFHLHFGTALGAHREKSFIKHDHDIDVAVFYKDVNTQKGVNAIITAMEDEGFKLEKHLGKITRGNELTFVKNDVPLDIFWVYDGEYRGKKYNIVASYFGKCDNLPHKICVWGYRPYNVYKVNFLGETYNVVPRKTLVDMYGKDWGVPKNFSYEEGLEGGYTGFIKDYYKPVKNVDKIAFCFLLYDTVKHRGIWEKFFKQDDNFTKTFSIYSHLKQVTDKTPGWIKSAKIRSIKTGWCEENLVHAWQKLIKAALEDKNNKYFCILSGECIPLFTYHTTYKKITSTKKSRINIDNNAQSYVEAGLRYADQWVILNRRDAKLLLALKYTEKGKKFTRDLRKKMCLNDRCFCYDEIGPISWFESCYHGINSTAFKKEFKVGPTTYTFWSDKGKPHPVKFTYPAMMKMRKKICSSGAIFGRKFNSKAANALAMQC